MKIGVVKETYPGEQRVALVPSVLPSLIKGGMEVIIESNIPMRRISKKVGESPTPVDKSLRFQILSSKSACWGPTPKKGRWICPVCEKAKCSLEWRMHWVIHNLSKS
jgi:hypothetical protein